MSIFFKMNKKIILGLIVIILLLLLPSCVRKTLPLKDIGKSICPEFNNKNDCLSAGQCQPEYNNQSEFIKCNPR